MPLPLLAFLFATCVLASTPIILLLAVARRRINRRIGCALLAAGFAGTTSYTLWRMEWFDVWRHGVPPLSLLAIYAVYAAVFGAIGWFLARAILPPSTSHRPLFRAQRGHRIDA